MQQKKRILITGGAGFIGSHCVDLFLAHEYEVGVFDIKTKVEAINLSGSIDSILYTEGDIRERVQLDAIMGEYTHVLHLAANVSVPYSVSNPIDTHNTNVTGTLNVFESATTHGIQRVVYASSAAVYGNTQIVPTHEDVPVAPLSPYGLHKVMNEEYAQLYRKQYGLDTVGLRFFNVYGSRQDPFSPYSGVISIFNKQLQEGEVPQVFGDGSATRDFIHVHDVARACLSAIEVKGMLSSVYNIGTGSVVSIEELVHSLNYVLGTKIKPIFKDVRIGDIMHSCAAVERMKTGLAIGDMKNIEDGLKELCEGV